MQDKKGKLRVKFRAGGGQKHVILGHKKQGRSKNPRFFPVPWMTPF